MVHTILLSATFPSGWSVYAQASETHLNSHATEAIRIDLDLISL